jgi:hypothetical protein
MNLDCETPGKKPSAGGGDPVVCRIVFVAWKNACY